MKHQRGYISFPDEIFVGLFVAGIAIGAAATAILIFGLPWLWGLVESWLHEVKQ